MDKFRPPRGLNITKQQALSNKTKYADDDVIQ